jgi:hypothetical protein
LSPPGTACRDSDQCRDCKGRYENGHQSTAAANCTRDFHLNGNFRFASPIPTRSIDRTAFLDKVLAGFGARVSSGAGRRRILVWRARDARKYGLSNRFCRHFALRSSVVIEMRSALRSLYPASMGKAAIFRIMPANNRRVRWLSARSSQ